MTSLPNQDNPLMDMSPVQGIPMLNTMMPNVDVWEYAYYLHYLNKRISYVDAYWNVVDWRFVEALYEEVVNS